MLAVLGILLGQGLFAMAPLAAQSLRFEEVQRVRFAERAVLQGDQLRATGSSQAARQQYQAALEVYTKVYGEQHPKTQAVKQRLGFGGEPAAVQGRGQAGAKSQVQQRLDDAKVVRDQQKHAEDKERKFCANSWDRNKRGQECSNK